MMIAEIPEIGSSLSEEDTEELVKQYANDFTVAVLLSLLELSILEADKIDEFAFNQKELHLTEYVKQTVYSEAIRRKVAFRE